MRQISNEFVVLSQQDVRNILDNLSENSESSELLMQLKQFANAATERRFYSASELHLPPMAEPRLQYVQALVADYHCIRSSEQDAQLLESTKEFMSGPTDFRNRALAIRRVREITGWELQRAANWVDTHYQKDPT